MPRHAHISLDTHGYCFFADRTPIPTALSLRVAEQGVKPLTPNRSIKPPLGRFTVSLAAGGTLPLTGDGRLNESPPKYRIPSRTTQIQCRSLYGLTNLLRRPVRVISLKRGDDGRHKRGRK